MPNAGSLSDAAAIALCGIAVAGMVKAGVDPILAAAFGDRACRPFAKKAVKKGGKIVRRKASKWNAHVKKEWAAYKRKYPNGKKTFAAVAKTASRSYKR